MIKPAAARVGVLIEELGASKQPTREAAIARLIILGDRAIARLVSAYEAADRQTQVAILRVLEASADGRALPSARHAIASGGDVAVAGVGVLREISRRGTDTAQIHALDALVGLARDPTAERRVRLAAAEALQQSAGELEIAVSSDFQRSLSATAALWADAADGHLPDDPCLLRAAIAECAAQAPLPELRRIIEALRNRENAIATTDSTSMAQRQEWRAVRGFLHQELALRGSRVALYDLRETVESSCGALPPTFLAAMQLVGDESCLEPLAVAFAHTSLQQERWRHQLASAFRAVAKRERLTTRHSAMRRAFARSPQLAQAMGH